jgi:hypothetical protein
MMRLFLLTAALVVLGACSTPGSSAAWYEHGDATYDELKRATDACKATGGDFHVKEGGDPTHLGDYACVKPDKEH